MEQQKNKLSSSEIIAKINRDIPIIISHYEKTHPEPISYRHKKTPRDT